MYSFVKLVILYVFVFWKVEGQVVQFGECPDVETMRYFSIDKFLGKWYEIERYPAWYEDYGVCAFKFINACGRTIKVDHGFIRDGVQYILHTNSTYAPAADAVFEINKSNIDPIGIPLTVIKTDYSNYAVVYGCKNNTLLGVRYISAWILSRHQTLSEEVLDEARQELNSIPNAYLAYLNPVPQLEENCGYHWTAHVHAKDYNTGEDDDFKMEVKDMRIVGPK